MDKKWKMPVPDLVKVVRGGRGLEEKEHRAEIVKTEMCNRSWIWHENDFTPPHPPTHQTGSYTWEGVIPGQWK